VFAYQNDEALKRILLLEKGIGKQFIEKLQINSQLENKSILNYLSSLYATDILSFEKNYRKIKN
jgi:hypothetical protein